MPGIDSKTSRSPCQFAHMAHQAEGQAFARSQAQPREDGRLARLLSPDLGWNHDEDRVHQHREDFHGDGRDRVHADA